MVLANYFAGALVMPYERFLQTARDGRYDVEILGHRFRTSFEQVCHRLCTLRRPGAEGIPFHMVRVDIAGNLSKSFSATGIHFARFSAACPRWNVHQAFLTPGRTRTQLSQMTDGQAFFCIARTISKEFGGFHKPASVYAIGLGCDVLHAPEMVYDLPANGKRLIQKIDGYRYTIQSGEVTYEDGEPTGALPGKLVRGPQPAPSAA